MKLRRTFLPKRQRNRQKSLCKKVYKYGGTNTVLSHAFPSTLFSHYSVSADFCVSGVQQSALLWIAKRRSGKQIEFYLLLNRLCFFVVVVSRKLYFKLFITPRINQTRSCLKNSVQIILPCIFNCTGLYLC